MFPNRQEEKDAFAEIRNSKNESIYTISSSFCTPISDASEDELSESPTEDAEDAKNITEEAESGCTNVVASLLKN